MQSSDKNCKSEKSLIRLTCDRERAKDRCTQICNPVNKIDDEESNREVKVFKAVADPTRLKILKLLTGGELCVREIMTALKKPQSSISHNLSILEDVGLIKERKEGRLCHYRLSDRTVIEMINLARLIKGK